MLPSLTQSKTSYVCIYYVIGMQNRVFEQVHCCPEHCQGRLLRYQLCPVHYAGCECLGSRILCYAVKHACTDTNIVVGCRQTGGVGIGFLTCVRNALLAGISRSLQVHYVTQTLLFSNSDSYQCESRVGHSHGKLMHVCWAAHHATLSV